MTTRQLNSRMKKIWKEIKDSRNQDTTHWTKEDWDKYEAHNKDLGKRFRMLWHDSNIPSMSADCLRCAIAINGSLRYIPLHIFCSYVNP